MQFTVVGPTERLGDIRNTPYRRLSVHLHGSMGTFSVTDWFYQETGWEIVVPRNEWQESIADFSHEKVFIAWEQFETIEVFVITLLHEIGHVVLNHNKGPIEQIEREAWRWTFDRLRQIRDQQGWDIRTLPGFTKEKMKAKIVTYYTSHEKGSEETAQGQFDPTVLEAMIDDFWDS